MIGVLRFREGTLLADSHDGHWISFENRDDCSETVNIRGFAARAFAKTRESPRKAIPSIF
jgi:hypothetical protein